MEETSEQLSKPLLTNQKLAEAFYRTACTYGSRRELWYAQQRTRIAQAARPIHQYFNDYGTFPPAYARGFPQDTLHIIELILTTDEENVGRALLQEATDTLRVELDERHPNRLRTAGKVPRRKAERESQFFDYIERRKAERDEP